MKPLTDIANAILDASNCGETVAVTVAKYIWDGWLDEAARHLSKTTSLRYDEAEAIVCAAAKEDDNR